MSRSTGFFFFRGISLIVLILCAPYAACAQLNQINYRVIDAEYSRKLDKIVTVAAMPQNQLHVYDPETGLDTAVDDLRGAIVGIEIAITEVAVKFKLSQNKDAADYDGVRSQLATSPHVENQLVAKLMAPDRYAKGSGV